MSCKSPTPRLPDFQPLRNARCCLGRFVHHTLCPLLLGDAAAICGRLISRIRCAVERLQRRIAHLLRGSGSCARRPAFINLFLVIGFWSWRRWWRCFLRFIRRQLGDPFETGFALVAQPAEEIGNLAVRLTVLFKRSCKSVSGYNTEAEEVVKTPIVTLAWLQPMDRGFEDCSVKAYGADTSFADDRVSGELQCCSVWVVSRTLG